LQGIKLAECSHSELLQTLDNEGNGSLRFARRVKIRKKRFSFPFMSRWYFILLLSLTKAAVIAFITSFFLIFMCQLGQDSGIKYI